MDAYRPTTKARANLTAAMGVEFLSFPQKPGSQTRLGVLDNAASLTILQNYWLGDTI
ncbi:hypothetical protein [Microcoleus sp.]|uniref:hypothetical protein n=1 Tax=Microcoleus sp. TaxID=44472 RepID=UPI00403E7ECB